MKKLIRSGATYKMSFHVRDTCKACPCVQLLGCLLGHFGIFVQLHLIDDRVSFRFPFCCCRMMSSAICGQFEFAQLLKAFFGLVCGFNKFPFPTRPVKRPLYSLTWRLICLCHSCMSFSFAFRQYIGTALDYLDICCSGVSAHHWALELT